MAAIEQADELLSLAQAGRLLGMKRGTFIRRRTQWAPRLGMRKVGGRWRCSAAKVRQMAAGADFITVDAMDPRAQGFLALLKEAKDG